MVAFRESVSRHVWYGDAVHPDEDFLSLIWLDGVYLIYSTVTGKPFLPIKFTEKEKAVQFGAMLHQWYGEYFWIGSDKEWAGVDIPRLVQYTIPDGLKIQDLIEKNRHKILTDLSEFMPYFKGE